MTIPIAESGVTVTVPLQLWAGALLNETLEMSFKQSERRKLMVRIRRNVLELFLLTLLVVSSAFSIGQLNARAQTKDPNCAGLACTAGSDCGTKCFCNRPTGTCIVDA